MAGPPLGDPVCSLEHRDSRQASLLGGLAFLNTAMVSFGAPLLPLVVAEGFTATLNLAGACRSSSSPMQIVSLPMFSMQCFLGHHASPSFLQALNMFCACLPFDLMQLGMWRMGQRLSLALPPPLLD